MVGAACQTGSERFRRRKQTGGARRLGSKPAALETNCQYLRCGGALLEIQLAIPNVV